MKFWMNQFIEDTYTLTHSYTARVKCMGWNEGVQHDFVVIHSQQRAEINKNSFKV